MEKYYRIADLNVIMSTCGRTAKQAEKYEVSPFNHADIIISSYYEDMKVKHPGINDDDCEYLGTGASFNKELLKFDGFRLHASAIVVDEKAYLFSANSGVGKSTHTSLWLKKFGDKAYILNDDKPAIRLINGIWYAFGTPWSGKNDISRNVGVPIAGICFLERALENEIQRYTGKAAIFDLYVQSNRPRSTDLRIKLLELFDHLLLNVPVWKLRCNISIEAADLSYRMMSNKEEDKGL